jgi:hypothetical protein
VAGDVDEGNVGKVAFEGMAILVVKVLNPFTI